MSKPSVTIVTTGGTISSKYDTRGGENVPAASAEELVASVPELSSAAQVRVVEHSNVTSDVLETSTAFGLRDRLRGILADEETAGAVITHGTATMEETAYLLDLTLGGEKPVVITGAMRNAVARDADGPRNIFYAAKIAADPEARGRGVLVALDGEIFAARDVIKVHSQRPHAFASRDGGPIGVISDEGVFFHYRPERRLHFEVDAVKENVQFLTVTQGVNDLLVRACIRERSGRHRGGRRRRGQRERSLLSRLVRRACGGNPRGDGGAYLRGRAAPRKGPRRLVPEPARARGDIRRAI